MNEVLLIAGMALVTFGVRYPVMALVGKIPLPDRVFRALKFVPAAVLTAIIVPATVFGQNGQLDLRLENSYLLAAIISVTVAWRSHNLLITIVLGMLALWGWRWLLASHLLG